MERIKTVNQRVESCWAAYIIAGKLSGGQALLHRAAMMNNVKLEILYKEKAGLVQDEIGFQVTGDTEAIRRFKVTLNQTAGAKK